MSGHVSISRTRKIIDLDVDVKAALSYQAVKRGMNLKSYIESTLRWVSEQEEDKILAEIAKEEVGEIATKTETAAFLDDLSQYLPKGTNFAK